MILVEVTAISPNKSCHGENKCTRKAVVHRRMFSCVCLSKDMYDVHKTIKQKIKTSQATSLALSVSLLCSDSHNDAPAPQQNVSMAAIWGAVRPSIVCCPFVITLFGSPVVKRLEGWLHG